MCEPEIVILDSEPQHRYRPLAFTDRIERSCNHPAPCKSPISDNDC